MRAAAFAALCVVMSSTTHILLSRTPLPLPVLLAAAVAIFAVAYALGGRERGFVSIAAALIPLELASDTLFNAGQHTCYGPGGGPVTGSWRSLHEAIICGGGGTGGVFGAGSLTGTSLTGAAFGGGSLAERTAASAARLSVSPWLLLTAHLVVGLAAACLLRCGEAWLHRSARAVFRPLLVALALLHRTVRERPAPPAAAPAPAARALPLLLHSLVRRGPPVLAA